ncbi:MAG: CBS domain-containing protein [Desulfurococcales archaeon]|nr:CBS domain-containing protein [Desulfurococcales archaeon]
MTEALRRYRVEELMTKDPVAISPTTTVLEAAKLMDEIGVGALPVVDRDRRLIGIFSERDIVRRVIAKERPLATPISEVMTRDVIIIGPNDTVEDALKLMARFNIRHLPVVDEKGVLIGIISIKDIEAALL